MEYLDQADQAKLKALLDKNTFADEALRQLDRILASPAFARLQDKAKGILGFGVAKKLLGQEAQVKEISIAWCVYKDKDYDPAVDNKIRVAGVDLRKRLSAYAEGEGRNDPFEILLPDGTFVPEIRDRRLAISVMRFENWNPHGDQDHFCELIRDEIVSRLRHVCSVRASRDSLPGETGNQHRYLLRGSLECPDNRLKLNMSLSDTHTGRIISSASFEGRRDDLLNLPGRVVEASLKALQSEAGAPAAIAVPRSHEKFEAVQLYRQGRWHLRRRTDADIRRAIALFQQAIEANSEYAAAYSGLADCHLILSWYELSTPDRVWFEIAKDHALTAAGTPISS
jgi:TolB-like protein